MEPLGDARGLRLLKEKEMVETLMTVDEVAKALKIHRRTVLRLIECDDLEGIEVQPHTSKKKQWRVSPRELERYQRESGTSSRAM